jgi:hypothetical protein
MASPFGRRLLWALPAVALVGLAALGVATERAFQPGARSPLSPPAAIARPASPLLATPSPTARPNVAPAAEADATLRVLGAAAVPSRDLDALARRLKRVEPGPLPAPAGGYAVGNRQQFWVTDQTSNRHFTVTATLRYAGEHLYMYAADGVSVADADLQRSADEFDAKIWPAEFAAFGTAWKPGRDGDRHLTVLNGRIPGVAGYYSAADEYAPEVNPHTNQRRMVYMNVEAVRPGTPAYAGTLAHEFQHALLWSAAGAQDSWLNEGLSELATHVAGYPVASLGAFAAAPDTQLNAWPPGANLQPHYGASYLFLLYLWDHYRAADGLKRLESEPNEGIRAVDDYLRAAGLAEGFDDVFRDWIIANYLQQPDGGRYGYRDERFRLATGRSAGTGETSGRVGQYAAVYHPLRYAAAGARLRFAGAPAVRVIPTDPPGGGRLWWSNAGDNRDSTLTRALDLTAVRRATLRFGAWWETEEDWDYAYVEVSADEGRTWTALPTTHTTDADPVGQAYGPGFTGQSGGKAPAWLEETADLTPFAGKQVRLRFEYVTDDAVNGTGFAVRDIAVPEVGFRDDAEGDAGWEAAGFVRIANALPQRWRAAVVYGDGQVDWLPVGADGGGELRLREPDRGGKPAVLVVAAATPHTYQPAQYTVAIEP